MLIYEEDTHLPFFLYLQELDDMNAARAADFSRSEQKKQEKELKKRKEGDSHKQAILKRLLQKRQRLKA